MKKVGITGGIGAGKSIVCKVFELLSIPIYYADDRAKWLLGNNAALIEKVKREFGQQVYDEQNRLKRKVLANIVFANPDALALLNSMVHPAVRKDTEEWNAQQSAPYTLREAALVYETGMNQHLDKVIVVDAPEEIRIQRVLARDTHSTVESIKKRIAQQMPAQEKVKLADYVIDNSGKQLILPQILDIHRSLLAL